MKRIASVLLWSVIAAAFIGPGTVASAASAGAGFGYALLWALVFSTGACLVLQEASARLTVASGKSLAEALRSRGGTGWREVAVLILVLGAVVLGCAAYEAGNILGGVAGAVLTLPWSAPALAVTTVALAAVLLFFNSPRRVAFLLSFLVAMMGAAFLWTAILLAPDAGELFVGAFWPSLPEGASLLAIALVGTTVVPYNLFLGSGLARGQNLSEIRFGLTIAVILGGVISMAVVVVGAALEPPFTFGALAEVLAERLGPRASTLLGLGLFSAGLSSAVTAPLAAAITARGLFGGESDVRWSDRSWRFRSVWAGVLAVGLGFGVSGVQPVPVIIVAQALNGVLLPVAAVFLLVAVNDPRIMGKSTNHALSNAIMVLVSLVTLLLGTSNVLRAVARALGREAPGQATVFLVSAVLAVAITTPIMRSVRRRSHSPRLE